MKTKVLLAIALTTNSIAFSQVQFPQNATSGSTTAERIASFTVSGSGNDRLEITNATDYDGQFVPTLWAYRNTDNRHVLGITTSIPSSLDNGTTPLMIFSTSITNSIQLNAPTNGTFPWGNAGTGMNITNRPLFQWRNNSMRLMTMIANGNIGIGTETPTALFHNKGSLRFENLPIINTNTYVLTTDELGNVSRQLTPNNGGTTNFCSNLNFITKTGSNGLTCSQIYDSGTNIGINTTTPTAKLHNNGSVRLENLPNVNTNTYLIGSDINGNLTKQITNFGNLSSTCFTTNFIPKNNGTALTCSQIFDNGTSVGIGTSSNFNYSTSGLATTTTGYTTGTLKLNIAGVTRGNVFISTSDQSYKLNITPISDALSKVLKLNGVTYNWDLNNYPSMNFDGGDHSGLIAQDVEEILPHIVYTVNDDEKDTKGKKAVNYIELIPYLIEAIKNQQEQITILQNQLNGTIQITNGSLLKFNKTKIISVTPNPSSTNVIVTLNIDVFVEDAKLIIYDFNGKIMSSLTIKERKNDISKTILKDNFGNGTYIVSLSINNKIIDTKKIIFN
jgi:hypothetical protein